ncbi:MAG: YpdA family putative bacillithiol disulfide reductase [Bacteroidia bacterium]|nr:YpdA family putative bacillithiol disulfide reductase [Bacteroidia bacterium]NNF31804.1 YpdA family putative bacillithiol disulfide reductase [Flavobacteriaceae bacterium]MBT8276233.1 YpdA family putative bacillithiol disulfide reductase [Bacteroidia bacterium]NNJ81322.1 YpdA family putative bacillithiol disulfide reductase [Flavobacteriaceae bacterium]NNK53357.1 YpdA family putative bacillithiol disulfide reductase [Flavobacteriaceae bacterium]
MKNEIDVLIIGAGPIGIACALECKKRDLSYVVVEKGALTNSLYNYPLNMTFFSTSEKLEIDDIPFISANPKPNRDEALEYYRRVATSNKLNINLYETIESVKKADGRFQVISNKRNYTANNLIVSTGFYDIPKLLDVPGEALPKVSHYFKEAHPYVMQKTIVVGASNSAVDAALEIWRKGGDVTMVIRGPGIGERVKYWVKPDIENRISEGSIKALFNAEITEVREDEVTIKTPDGIKILENDYVVALTGYRPNFDFLKSIGVELSSDGNYFPSYNPETMESNVPGLYLAGVICGGMETHKWFIENSRVHASIIANSIAASINTPHT